MTHFRHPAGQPTRWRLAARGFRSHFWKIVPLFTQSYIQFSQKVGDFVTIWVRKRKRFDTLVDFSTLHSYDCISPWNSRFIRIRRSDKLGGKTNEEKHAQSGMLYWLGSLDTIYSQLVVFSKKFHHMVWIDSTSLDSLLNCWYILLFGIFSYGYFQLELFIQRQSKDALKKYMANQ